MSVVIPYHFKKKIEVIKKMSRWLAKYKNSPEMPIQRTDNTDTGNKVIDFQEEAQKRGYPFPYPINETLGIGEYDPLDVRWVNGKPVLDPGWWKKIPRRRR